MILLAIETSTKQLGVAILRDATPLSSFEAHGTSYPHAAELPGAVTRVLQEARVTLKQVEAIAVDIGPGSFTGLRIGLAFVKALTFAKKTAVIGVPSLDVLASGISFATKPICPILDAKQKNVYAALYSVGGSASLKQADYFLGPIEEFLVRVKGPTIFLGEGCALYSAQIEKQLGNKAQFAPQELWLPRAVILGRLGYERLCAGLHDDPSSLAPLYLYPLDCSVRGPDRPTAVLPKTAAAA